MKKNKLIIEYEYGFDLVGVATSLHGYRLAWEINRITGVRLSRHEDLIVGFKSEGERAFSYYSFETRLNKVKLFKNKSVSSEPGKYFLVPEHPHYDFVVMISMEEDGFTARMMEGLRALPAVALVAPLAVDQLKSRSNFVF